MRNSADYAKRSTLTIIRVFMIYKPMRFFAWPGIVLLIAGGIIGLRFLVLYVLGGGQGLVQSLILAAILIVVGTILCIFSLIAADLIAVNRRLLEELQTRARSLGWLLVRTHDDALDRTSKHRWMGSKRRRLPYTRRRMRWSVLQT